MPPSNWSTWTNGASIYVVFDLPVTVAALLTIPLIVVEESDYGQPWDAIGVMLNWGTWLVFLAEIVVMLRVVPDRKRWVRENPVAVGVTALTPPFLSLFAPLRLLRLLRLVRLARWRGVCSRHEDCSTRPCSRSRPLSRLARPSRQSRIAQRGTGCIGRSRP